MQCGLARRLKAITPHFFFNVGFVKKKKRKQPFGLIKNKSQCRWCSSFRSHMDHMTYISNRGFEFKDKRSILQPDDPHQQLCMTLTESIWDRKSSHWITSALYLEFDPNHANLLSVNCVQTLFLFYLYLYCPSVFLFFFFTWVLIHIWLSDDTCNFRCTHMYVNKLWDMNCNCCIFGFQYSCGQPDLHPFAACFSSIL